METREAYTVNVPTIIKGGVAVDDRGTVTFCNDFDMSVIKRFYMLENWQEGFTRAWHGHIKEAKWIVCVSGAAIVGAGAMLGEGQGVDHPDRFVLYPNGDVLYIPPRYANGHKNLVQGTRLIHFSNLTQEEARGDDTRLFPSVHGWVWEIEER